MSVFWLDGLVIAAYFGLILWIGMAQRGHNSTVAGFALGDREIAWWAVLASILAAEISAATFLGAPGEGYANRNFAYAQLAIGTILARMFVAWIFIPAFYRQNVVSIYEFLENRFGKTTRNMASATFLVTRVLASGTRLYVSAILLVLAFEMVFEVHPTFAQEFAIYAGVLALLSVLTLIYTAVGGIRAVIWTDVIQVGVLFAALIFSICYLLHRIPGGWDGVVAQMTGPNDLQFFSLGTPSDGTGVAAWLKSVLEQEYTLWTALFGATFVTLATHGTDQDMVQRMLTAKNRRQSGFATVMSGLVDLPVVFSFLLIGILLWVFYQTTPDAALPDKNPHIFPYFILHEMPSGLRGLVVAGVLATAMGSLSTALNALATSFARDWLLPRAPWLDTEVRKVRALRWSTAGFAFLLMLVGMGTALMVLTIPGSRIIPIVLGIFGYTYGSLLGVFLLGLLTKTRGNDLGNVCGMIAGFVAVAYLSGLDQDLMRLVGMTPLPRPEWVPTLAFPWRVTVGTLVTLAVSCGFSSRAQGAGAVKAGSPIL